MLRLKLNHGRLWTTFVAVAILAIIPIVSGQDEPTDSDVVEQATSEISPEEPTPVSTDIPTEIPSLTAVPSEIPINTPSPVPTETLPSTEETLEATEEVIIPPTETPTWTPTLPATAIPDATEPATDAPLVIDQEVISLPSHNCGVEEQPRVIRFSGMDWYVKSGSGLGPNTNDWSDSRDSVWVDGKGLHLVIRKDPATGLWYSAEVCSVKPTRNGMHRFEVVGQIDLLDPNVVLGLFLYKNDNMELDIEFTTWGSSDPTVGNGQYVVQPSTIENFWFRLNGTHSTHYIDWCPEQIQFKSIHGHYNEPPETSYLIHQWLYPEPPNPGTDNPSEDENLHIHMNLWLAGTSPHAPVNPDLTEIEVIIDQVRVNYRPGRPVLVGLENRAITPLTQPELSWQDVDASNFYQIQIANAANFKTVTVDATSRQLNFVPNTPLSDGQYFWRVRGLCGSDVGAWSSTRTFEVDTLPPDPPEVVRPLAGSATTDSTPVFVWRPAHDAVAYQLAISTNPNCSTPLHESPELRRPTYTLPEANALTSENTYYWCVRGRDVLDRWGVYGPATGLEVALLKAPRNSNSIVDTTPTFQWNRAPGTGVTYRLIVSTNPNLSAPVIDAAGLTRTSYPVLNSDPLDAGETYYWRVEISGGTWTVADPVIWSFLLASERLTAPVIITPANGSPINDPSPLISWNAVDDIPGVAITYNVCVDEDARFGTPQCAVSVAGSSYEVNPPLPSTPKTRYYMYVQANYDNEVDGPRSRVTNFWLDTVAPATAPDLVAPADGSTAASNRPTFSWQTVSGAVRYMLFLEIGDNSPDVIAFEGTSRSYRSRIGLPSGQYFWQVIAYDAAGNESPASAIWNITIP